MRFLKKVIKVKHQLQRTSDMRYICEKTKTENGVREVPMTPDVMNAFKRIIKMRPKPKIEPIVDGYSGFLFLDKNGKPRVALHWEKYFQLSVAKYNKIYRVQLPKNVSQSQCLCGLAKIYTSKIYWYKFLKTYQFIYHLTEKICSVLRSNDKTTKTKKPQTQ